MDYTLENIPGFETRKITLRAPGVFSGAKLFVGGEEVKASWGKFTLRRDDGSETTARWANNMIDPMPQLMIDGKTYSALKPLEWYELVWAGFPAILVFVGGLLGGIFGILAAYSNVRIFRSDLQPVVKYIVVAVISGAAFVAYFVIGIGLTLLLQS